MAARLIYVSAAPRTRVAGVVTAASRIMLSGCVAAATTIAAAAPRATKKAAIAATVSITTAGTRIIKIRCRVAANKEAAAGLRKGGTPGGAGSHTSRRSSNRKPAAVDCPRRPPRPKWSTRATRGVSRAPIRRLRRFAPRHGPREGETRWQLQASRGSTIVASAQCLFSTP